jgi:hypothetical protein
MTSGYWGDHGYDYVYALSDAISSYTSSLEAEFPASCSYRGISLRFAVERILFTNYVTDPRLISLYDTLRKTGEVPESSFSDPDQYGLARHLILPLDAPLAARIRRRGDPAGWLLQQAKSTIYSRWPRGDDAIDLRDKLLAFVVHEKFVRFFSDIIGAYPGAGAYLSPHRAALGPDWHGPAAILPFRRFDPGGLGRGSVLPRFPRLLLLCSALLAAFERGLPEALLIPEGCAPEYEVVNRVCQEAGVPSICIQNGWAPYIHSGFRNMSFTRMFVWGTKFRDLLQGYNPRQEFVVTGSHLISTGPAADPAATGIAFFLQEPGTQLISTTCWEHLLELISWTAGSFPARTVYVREHPSFPIPEGDRASLLRHVNLRLAPPREYTLDRLLKLCSLSVSVHSSTILESIAAAVLPVIYNETPMPCYHPDVHGRGAGVEVRTPAEAKEALALLLRSPSELERYRPAMDSFRSDFFEKGKSEALAAILAGIEDAVSEKKRERG